jgi:hypothetical protein
MTNFWRAFSFKREYLSSFFGSSVGASNDVCNGVESVNDTTSQGRKVRCFARKFVNVIMNANEFAIVFMVVNSRVFAY